MQIVPIENIEGRKAAEEGDTCLRRTFSGVDLNRNWGIEWKQKVCKCLALLSCLVLACCVNCDGYLLQTDGSHRHLSCCLRM